MSHDAPGKLPGTTPSATPGTASPGAEENQGKGLNAGSVGLLGSLVIGVSTSGKGPGSV